ncbi:hypothetical protein ACUY3H_04485 [Corynebacterium ureicelerivorans]
MSDETERLARKWAERIKAAPDETYVDDVVAAAEHILATTTPPTMADVEWDDEKHYLTGAVDIDGYDVVMFGTREGNIRVCEVSEVNEEFAPVLEKPVNLTPNGKRYELREVGAPEQPAHPATLVTEQDYENAPEGTIVNIDGTVAIRGVYGWICTGEDAIYRTRGMFDQGEGDVIRWGWGK